MIICNAPTECASALLNPNSVPDSCQIEFAAAQRRLAILMTHIWLLPADIELARKEFFYHLETNWTKYRDRILSVDFEVIAYADGQGYLARLHGILSEFKSFLDLFAHFLTKLVPSKNDLHGFNKGKVKSHHVAGGKFINWLAGHGLERLANRELLVETFFTASRNWITEMVADRDTIVHYRDLPNFNHMQISLTSGPTQVQLESIRMPTMPDGKSMTDFAEELQDRLCTLISDIMPLLPNVHASMNAKWSDISHIVRRS